MKEKMKMKKEIRSVMIVFLAVVIPGYIKLFYGNTFTSVRTVDLAQLVVTGIFTGVLIMSVKDYLRMNKVE